MNAPPQNLIQSLAARRLLVIGGLNVDQHLRVETLPDDDGSARILKYSTAFGGHAGNCACALARLGVSVAVFGAVGTDADGAALIADLEASGVDTNRIRRVSEMPTGRVVIPCFPDRRYMLMHRGANEIWPVRHEEIAEAVAGFDSIVLFDPVVQFADALFEVLRGRTTKLYWNPGGLLAGLPWTRTRLACADVVIMNRAEVRAAFERTLEEGVPTEVCQDRPSFRLIETLGREGARLHGHGRRLHVSSFPAQAVDETGAGDAFTAGFVAFDSIGFDEPAALRFASAVAACATESLGARAGLPNLTALLQRWDLVADLSASIAPLNAAVQASGGLGHGP